MSIDLSKKYILINGIFPESFFRDLKKRHIKDVVILEGRPSLASLRTSTKMALKFKITPIVISDNMPGFLFKHTVVQEVWLAQQSADKKDISCAVGSLILAVLAKKHNVSLYSSPAGKKSPAQGKPKDLFYFAGVRIAPPEIKAFVPLVERIPQKYLTEKS